ncbi:penicillin-binding protein 2 [Prevotella aff. ruminicola Tc2-24]|uniref:Penicillin-binding protein 2 n=1 Tax=Prevotella aff. ruminicola Tc2-24 TaxID=81582 RepID=A0A1I0PNL3_9BACT|nr:MULTISPECIES: penicillin-binding protein 2 [Prevotella]SEE42448.1 penicillin-binding protein 2 [Prevotella sp. lc2012]SEW16017.1 penicillin-binding protein 2 [Prevotella aff. ruminicola Tc2-24]
MKDYGLGYRRYVIGGVAVLIVVIYIIRLFTLQITSDDYKKSADSNAFLKKIEYPSRGNITDRHGKLLVYNQPSYDIMVVMNEAKDRIDTTEFCHALGITKEEFDRRMTIMKDRNRNPGYSRFTQQLFISQLSDKDFSVFQEKMFRFPGFYVQKRSVRQYQYPMAAHVLGDVAEASPADIEEDDYYQPGDYIGKSGVERRYEKELRGEKGIQILLRDAHGRVQGRYKNGELDHRAVPGKNLTLSIDASLQELGERLMEGKIGSIVAIEPSTGEVLCMVSSPSYDPRMMVGRQRSKNHRQLSQNVWKPLLNRSVMGQYPPGSTFKTTQGLTFMSEGIITQSTMYPCSHGFNFKGLHVGCHGHAAPLPLVPALSTSCNGFFCWGLYHMIGNKAKYGSVQNAMNTWRDYMVSMGFGYKLGIDLPSEKRGMIPNAMFYDKAYKGSWNGLTIISIAIGQGEVTATPLQIANLGATIANRGYYYVPHVVRKVQGEPLDTTYTRRHVTKADRKAYDYVVQGMRSSVLGGTCHELGKYDFVACGKTGTAQNRGHDHSVFMGFAPMDQPKIAVAVYVENGGWGATYGVPIGGLIMEQYLKGKLSEASQAKAKSIQERRIAYGTTDR